MMLRLQGRGRAVLPGEADCAGLAGCFPPGPGRGAGRDGRRAVIVAELDRIASSCGYSVPVMELAGERDLLTRWTGRKSPGQLAAHRAERNAVSIDGLPALG